MRLLSQLLCTLLVLCWGSSAYSQPVLDMPLQPDYSLFGRAANRVAPRLPSPSAQWPVVGVQAAPLLMLGHVPTHRLPHFFPTVQLPKGAFTIEMWLLNHVNQPVGVSLALRSAQGQPDPHWLVGYYGRNMLATWQQANHETVSAQGNLSRGWKKYWLHLAYVFDEQEIRLYQEGNLIATQPYTAALATQPSDYLELAGYFANEPYMEIANLLKHIRIHAGALGESELKASFEAHQKWVEAGSLYPGIAHLNAGPYLHYVTPNSIHIAWETNVKMAQTHLRYGTALPLGQSVALPPPSSDTCFIQTHVLEGLQPATPYFYELVMKTPAGDTIRSGVNTFATAPDEEQPFTFAVIGDTEARPHINFRLSELVWDERPSFVLLLGDLTDGGQRPHKFEWNQEYFQGIGPLAARVPIFSVLGNGESDQHWYGQYHDLPDLGDAYTFRYGDVAFFMLNSNHRADFSPGGRQYAWLEGQLKACTARRKVVCHHHAPYSSDEDDYGNSWEGASDMGDLAVRKITPLYEQYGVDVVFFGHLHTYQRLLPMTTERLDERNGVVYVQAGGGGGNLEDFAPTHTWFSGKTYRGHHYLTVTVTAARMELRMYDLDGDLRDFFEVR